MRGRRVELAPADVSDSSAVKRMVERVRTALGPIDILVNNAGIETIVPFLELTDEQWTRLVDVNLRGAWLCSQVFCQRALAEGRKGSIVNIGSIQAAKVLPGRTHYAPTKLGLEWAAKMEKKFFVGRTALTRLAALPPHRRTSAARSSGSHASARAARAGSTLAVGAVMRGAPSPRRSRAWH